MSQSRYRVRLASALLAVLVPAAQGCRSDEAKSVGSAPNRPHGEAALLGVDILPETDSQFVGRVRALAVDASGEIFISDQFGRRILAFDRGRRIARVIGRAGSGPAEFSAPGALARWGSDTLVVADVPLQSIIVLDSLGVRHRKRLLLKATVISMAAVNGALHIGAMTNSATTAVATLHAGADSAVHWLGLPQSVLRNPQAARFFRASAVAARADTLAVAFLPSYEILIATERTGVVDRFFVPVAQRRPIPENLDEVFVPLASRPEGIMLFPSLDGIYWRPDGKIVVWYKSWESPQGGVRDVQHAATDAHLRIFVTLMDRQRRVACVDAEIPTNGAENPSVTGFGDTVFVAGHTVGAGAKPVLNLWRYRINEELCSWVKLD